MKTIEITELHPIDQFFEIKNEIIGKKFHVNEIHECSDPCNLLNADGKLPSSMYHMILIKWNNIKPFHLNGYYFGTVRLYNTKTELTFAAIKLKIIED